MTSRPTTDRTEEFFAGRPFARAVFDAVQGILRPIGTFDVRTTTSQVAFRRGRGFAYLWMPGRYLARPGAEAVLSIVLGRHDRSPRFKQVVHPAPAHWMHHLEIHSLDDLDDEVAGWLREAFDHAAE